MGIVPHDGKLSPYAHKPIWIRVVPSPLVSIRWRSEYLRGKSLPISCLDGLQDCTIRLRPNFCNFVVDEPFTRSCSFARGLRRGRGVQAKGLDARRVNHAPLRCCLELFHERLQVLDVARALSFVVWKIDPNGKAAAMNRRAGKPILRAEGKTQEPRFLPPHFGAILAVVFDCGTVRRVIVVQPNPVGVVHSNIALNF